MDKNAKLIRNRRLFRSSTNVASATAIRRELLNSSRGASRGEKRRFAGNGGPAGSEPPAIKNRTKAGSGLFLLAVTSVDGCNSNGGGSGCLFFRLREPQDSDQAPDRWKNEW